MNNKIFLFASCILTLIVFSGLVSAASLNITNIVVPASIGHDVGNFIVYFNISNSGADTNLTWPGSVITSGIATINGLSTIQLLSGQSSIINLNITFPRYQSGNISGFINVDPSGGGNSKNFTFLTAINSSSSLSLSQVTALTRDQNGTINVTNTGNTALTNINLTATSPNSKIQPRFNVSTINNLAAGASQLVTIYLANPLSALDIGTVYVNAKDSSNTNSNQLSFSLSNTRFCINGTHGDLSITGFSITNNGEGDDETWNPLDPIEIEVEVQNNDEDSSITDVSLEIAILDSNGNDVTDDFNLEDDIIDLGKITKDDSETATFVITDVPSDIEEGDYNVFVKAYKDGSESSQCVDRSNDLSNSDYELISIEKQYDSGVVIRRSDISNRDALCGSYLDLDFDVYNVGTDKEESVLVLVESRELGLSQKMVISDLRADEKESVSFSIAVPQNLTKSSYNIYITTFFDYDEGDAENPNSYDQDSYDDLDENYNFLLRVTGCNSQSSQSAITASLKSDAKVGNELVVEATITNPSTSSKDFVITAENYDSWAQLVSITPQTASINAGASQVVLIKFKPTQAGTQTFNIKTLSGSSITTQSVQVSVTEKTGFLTGAFSGAGSIMLYSIIGLFIVLILIVLVVIIRVSLSSPRRNTDF